MTRIDTLLGEAAQVIQIEIGREWLTFDGCTVVDDPAHCLDFWGIPIGEEGTFQGRQLGGSRHISLRQAALGTGEWSALYDVSIDGRQSYAYLSDFYGYQFAYWALASYQGRPQALLGNSFEAVVGRLHQIGEPPRVDWLAGVQTLTGSLNIFQSPTSVHTPAVGVWMLRRGEVLVANDRGVGLMSREHLIRSNGETLDYQSLLRRGIDKAIKGIESTLHGSDEEPTLYLSGGKDSRNVLALVHAGGFSRDVGVVSHDPEIRPPGPMRELLSQDLRIASGIVKMLGMHWATPSARTGIAVNLMEHLAYWQKYRAAQNYTYSPRAFLPVTGSSGPQVQIWGAGGEVLRGYFANQLLPKSSWWGEVAPHLADTPRAIAELYDQVTSQYGVSISMHWNARAAFTASILGDGTDRGDWVDLTNAFYRDFRNASHFGGRNMAWNSGTLQWYPLVQAEFLLAYEMLDPREAAQGKCQFDIIEMLDPTFNDWEFESGPWSSDLGYSANRVTAVGDAGTVREYWAWREAAVAGKPTVQVLSDDHETERKKFNRRLETQRRLEENVDVLAADHRMLSGSLTEGFFNRIRAEGQRYKTRAGYHLARTETLRGVLQPTAQRTAPLLFQRHREVDFGMTAASRHSTHPASPVSLFGDPVLQVETLDGRLTVSVEMQTREDLTEWSVYIFEESRRVHVFPYGREKMQTYSANGTFPTRVVAFFRRPDMNGASILLECFLSGRSSRVSLSGHVDDD